MAYFRECPYCGASLDPAEQCECIKEREIKNQIKRAASSEADVLLEKTKWEQEKLVLCF